MRTIPAFLIALAAAGAVFVALDALLLGAQGLDLIYRG